MVQTLARRPNVAPGSLAAASAAGLSPVVAEYTVSLWRRVFLDYCGPDFGPAARLAAFGLSYLVQEAAHDGIAPDLSPAAVAGFCRTSEETTARHLRALASTGWLRRLPGRAARYELHVPETAELLPAGLWTVSL